MFQQAEISIAETLQEKSVIAIKKPKLYSIPFTMKGVGELYIGKEAFLLTCIVLTIAVAVGYHHLCVEQQKELQTAKECEDINLICT